MVGVFSLCFVLSLSAVVDAATTQVPHQHHEHTEMENFSFSYDGSSQLMMVLAGKKCYIWTLTNDQLSSVHTDAGLRAIELKILGDINSAMFTVVPEAILASSIQHACGRHTESFYLVH